MNDQYNVLPDQAFTRLNIEQGSSDDVLQFSIDADQCDISEPIRKFFVGMAARHKGETKE